MILWCLEVVPVANAREGSPMIGNIGRPLESKMAGRRNWPIRVIDSMLISVEWITIGYHGNQAKIFDHKAAKNWNDIDKPLKHA